MSSKTPASDVGVGHDDADAERGEALRGAPVGPVPRDDGEVRPQGDDPLEIGGEPAEPRLSLRLREVGGEVRDADDAVRRAEGVEDLRGRGGEGDDAPRGGGGRRRRGGEERGRERGEEP